MTREDIFLRNSAWNFILDQKIKELPINSFVIAQMNDCKVITYKELSKSINKTINYLKETYSDDGFVFWSSSKCCYIICYNDELPSTAIRWTIMHEISHIRLEHVNKDTPALTRIRRIEHPIFEREADGFVRRVLCPSIVLHNCKALEVIEIMQLCGISKQAAFYRSEYIKRLEIRSKWRLDPLELKVENQFKSFTEKYLFNKFLKKVTIL